MNAQRRLYLTPQEYLELERAADFKSEYFAGEYVRQPDEDSTAGKSGTRWLLTA